jgi:Arginase/agmatinase/formimionoglutamate hydrolase, arginase family
MKTLRLLFPQWQGGNVPDYVIGARLLDWLAPETADMVKAEVPVPLSDGTELKIDGGVFGRAAVKRQLEDAARIIEEQDPDRIIVFGGDCHVSQAPFDYLNGKYDRKLGVLWLDSHPDVSTLAMHDQENAMVLGNLLGEGDPDFAGEVKTPLDPSRVMFGGLQWDLLNDAEKEIIDRNRIRVAGPAELAENSQPVLAWISENRITHLAVHLDVDVLDPNVFRGQLPANPAGLDFETNIGVMTFPQVARTIRDASAQCELVGLAIAEHMPWDAINLRNFLNELPIFK